MRYNGYMKYRILPEAEGGAERNEWTPHEVRGATFDDDGNPVAEEPEWSEPVECFISIGEISIIHNEDKGSYTRQRYEFITEQMDIDTDRVQLSLSGRLLGEFEVVYIQQTLLDRTKYVVEQ